MFGIVKKVGPQVEPVWLCMDEQDKQDERDLIACRSDVCYPDESAALRSQCQFGPDRVDVSGHPSLPGSSADGTLTAHGYNVRHLITDGAAQCPKIWSV